MTHARRSRRNVRSILLESFEPRQLCSAVAWTGKGNGLDWTDSRNWDANRVPAIDDDVTIANGGGVRVASGSQRVNSLTSSVLVTVDGAGASLEVATTSSLQGGLKLVQGTLGGTGDIAVAGPVTWNTGGHLAGSGVASFASEVHFDLDATSDSIKITGTRTVRLFGDENTLGGVAAGQFIALKMDPGTSIELAEGADFILNDGADILASTQSSVGPNIRLGEQSAIRTHAPATGGPGERTVMEARITGDGSGGIVVKSGTLALYGAVDLNGGFAVDAGATLRFLARTSSFLRRNSDLTAAGTVVFDYTGGGGQTFIDGVYNVTGQTQFISNKVDFTANADVQSFSGGGVRHLHIAGSEVRFDTGETLQLDQLTVTAGTLTGGDDIVVSGASVFDSHARFGGNATATFNGSLTIDINDNGGVSFSDGRDVVINGAATIGGTNAGNTFYAFYLDSSATLNVSPGATLTVNNDAFLNGHHTTVINNAGTIVKTGAASSDLGSPYRGDGVVHIKAGKLTFISSIQSDAGDFIIDAGATLSTGHTATLFGAGSTIAGAGSVELRQTNIRGTLDVGGTLDFLSGKATIHPEATVLRAGSTLRLAGDVTFNSGNLIEVETLQMFNGGRFAGSDDLVVDNAATWAGGFLMQGSGKSTFKSAVSVELETQTLNTGIIEGRHVVFNGNLTIGGSQSASFGFYLGESTTMEIGADAILRLNDSADIVWVGSRSVPRALLVRGAVTRGTIEKANIPANSISTIDAPLVFDGNGRVIVSQDRTLEVTIPTAQTELAGRYIIGGTLLMGAKKFATSSADVTLFATGSFGALSQLTKNLGTIKLEDGNDLAITPTGGTFVQGGTIDLSGDSVLTINGSLNHAGTSGEIVYRSSVLGASVDDIGRVVVTGGVDFSSPNSNVTVRLSFGESNYVPTAGTRYDVITSGVTMIGSPDVMLGATTITGLAALGGQDAQNIFFTVMNPLPVPTVVGNHFEFQTRLAHSWTFNTDVGASLDRSDFVLVNYDTGATLPATIGTLSYDASTFTATLAFTGGLADGNYAIHLVRDGITNANGAAMSDIVSTGLFVLAGDANRDRTVNFDDLLVLSQNYGSAGRTFSQGNFDYSSDGVVGFDDLLMLAQRYGSNVPTLTAAKPAQASVGGRRKGAVSAIA